MFSLSAVERHVFEAEGSEAFTDLMDVSDMLDYDRCGSLVSITGRLQRKFCFLEFVTALTMERSD